MQSWRPYLILYAEILSTVPIIHDDLERSRPLGRTEIDHPETYAVAARNNVINAPQAQRVCHA